MSTQDDGRDLRKGYLAACCAYAAWGFFPLYLHLLAHIDAIYIVMHRIVWACFFAFVLVIARRRLADIVSVLRQPRQLLLLSLAAIIVSLNWGVFIWAVGNQYAVEASLGYFINPLFSVLLGVLFFNERLSRLSLLAVLIAACGVGYLLSTKYGFPWVALALAATFGLYGVVKKLARAEADTGLAIESGLLLVPAIIFICLMPETNSKLALSDLALLVGGGLVTLLPLLAFAFAAQRIPLYALGMLQYIGPSIQLVVSILILQECFPRELQVCFALIWLALCFYTCEQLSLVKRRRVAL